MLDFTANPKLKLASLVLMLANHLLLCCLFSALQPAVRPVLDFIANHSPG
jgi:hypothetical protein